MALQGNVKSLIEVRPASSITFRGMAANVTPKTVEIVSTSQPFQIKSMETSLQDRITYELQTVQEGKHYGIKITNLLKQGNFNGYLKVLTDHPQKPEITIRVNAYIEGEISLRPQTILVGRLGTNQPERSGKVLLISNVDKPFQILSLEYDKALLDVNQQPLPREQGYSLEIRPKLDNIPVGTRQMTILAVETDVTSLGRQEIQVHVMSSNDASGPSPESILRQEGVDNPHFSAPGNQINPSRPGEPPQPKGSNK